MVNYVYTIQYPRATPGKVQRAIHLKTLQINKNKVLNKCSSNPQEGKKKITEMKNR